MIVYRHARGYYSEYLLMFHMAIIFCSGYLFRTEKVKNIKGVVRFAMKRIYKLWIPYVAFK